MAPPEDSRTDSPVSAVTDPARLPLGGRKPTDATPSDLQNMKPGQAVSAIREARQQGKDEAEKSSVKIQIGLDLDVEVHLTARIKGDITIGLL